MSETFVVIGGDAAGMSAASKTKRDAPGTDVIVFERGQWVSYAACGLPYYIKGEIDSLDDLVAITPEEFVEERNIDLRLSHDVTAIDSDAGLVRGEAEGKAFEQPYDTLLVATGARAVTPPFEGMDLDRVFTIHSMESVREIYEYMNPESRAIAATVGGGYGDGVEVRQYSELTAPTAVAVVGGGYVGIEMAEAFAARGLDVHLFEMVSHVLTPFGEGVAERVEETLRERDVELHLDTSVTGFGGQRSVESVVLDGTTVPVDMVLVGVGVAPNTVLAESAGADLGPTGAIATRRERLASTR